MSQTVTHLGAQSTAKPGGKEPITLILGQAPSRIEPLSIDEPVLEIDTTNFDTVDLTTVYEEINRLHQ